MTEEDLFHRARELPPAARAALLAAECPDADLRARVERLLAAHDAPDRRFPREAAPDTPPASGAPDAGAPAPDGATATYGAEPAPGETADHRPSDAPGTVLAGRYKLVEEIGEGGMGTVWMAQQTEPVKRLVAVKLIRAGMDSRAVLARFEAERQALALMDHPNIARVFDGGVTGEGHPFFVMELVKGVTITAFCDARRLTPRQRLELFIPVCQAIQHAHQKGVIHRDIKPGNVLVAQYDGAPVPKVIDFGIAKAAGQALTDNTLVTGFGAVVGTVEYMSPEQASLNQLDVDTRTDVYALGVLLYELLAGSPPFRRRELEKAGLLEMLRVVREEEPSRPSTKLSTSDALPTLSASRGTEPKKLTRLLRGELDWIVMKALAKDRARRYETATGFAADVARFLAGEPVRAVPPSAAYRLRTFARRNRGPVVAAGLLVTALVAGVAGTTLGLLRAERSRGDAEQALAAVSDEQGKTAQALDQVRDEQRKTNLALDQATAAERANRRVVARQYVARGADLLTQGDRAEALAWFVAALKADAPDPEREEAHRTRIGTTLRACPRPERFWLAGGAPSRLGFAPDGRTAFGFTRVETTAVVSVWDAGTGAERFPPLRIASWWSARGQTADPVAFSADGRRFRTLTTPKVASTDDEVRVWDAATGVALTPALAHWSPSLKEAYQPPTLTPDGGRVLFVQSPKDAQGDEVFVGGPRVTAALWDVDRNEPAFPALKLTGGVQRAFFGPGYKRIVTAGPRAVRVWDATTGAPVTDEIPAALIRWVPGGRYFVTAAPLGGTAPAALRWSVQVWDVASAAPLGPPVPLGDGSLRLFVNDLEDGLSPDGRRVVVRAVGPPNAQGYSPLRDVHLFDPATGRAVVPDVVATHTCKFSPDGRRLAGASADAVVIRDAETGRPAGAGVPIREEASGTQFSADGKRLLVTDRRQFASLWDAETGQPLERDLRLADANTGAGFGPDGRLAYVHTGDRARVWDATFGAPLTPVLPHPSPVVRAAFSPDGFRLLTACADGSLRLWPLTAGEPPARVLAYPGGTVLKGVQPLGADPKAFVTTTPRPRSSDRGPLARVTPTLQTHWAGGRPTVLATSWDEDWFNAPALSPDGSKMLVWAGRTPVCRLHDTATGRPVGPALDCGPGTAGIAAFSPDGGTLVTGASVPVPVGKQSVATIKRWDVAAGTPKRPPLTVPVKDSAQLLFARDGALLVASTYNEVAAWDTVTGRPEPGLFPAEATLFVPRGPEAQLVRTPDGKSRLFDLRTGTPFGDGFDAGTAGGLWSANARAMWTFESGKGGGWVTQLRDSRTGTPLGPPAELPSGRVAWPGPAAGATALPGEWVYLLDPETGRPTGVAVRHSGDARGTAWFDAAGRRLVTLVDGRPAGTLGAEPDPLPRDREVRRYGASVWDVRTGEPLAPPYPTAFGTASAGFISDTISGDGRTLVTRPDLNEARIIDLAPDPRPADALERAAEALSGRRLGADGAFVSLPAAECRERWAALAPDPEPVARVAAWHRRRAWAAHLAADPATADFHLGRASAATPADPAAHRDRAEMAFARGDWDRAATAAARATDRDPADAALWSLRGHVAMRRGRWAEAGDSFRHATDCPALDAHAERDHWRFYLFARARGDDPAAYRAACADLLARYAAREDPLVVLRWVTLRPGGASDLAPLVERAGERAGRDSPAGAAGILALGKLRAGRPADALALLNGIAPEESEGADRLVRTIALGRLKRWADARAELTRAKSWGERFVSGTGYITPNPTAVPDGARLAFVALLAEAEAAATPTPAEAVAAARAAVAAREKEAAADPPAPGRRVALAAAREELGAALLRAGDPRAAADPFRKALAAREQLATERPKDADAVLGYGRALNHFGDRAAGRDGAAERLDWHAKALEVLGPAAKAFPDRDDARRGVRHAYWGRGLALMDTEKFAKAAAEFDRALKLSTGPDRIDPLSFRAINRMRAGDTADALRDADALAAEDGPLAPYNAACVYAVASGQVGDKKVEYGDRPVGLLHRAVAAGFRDVSQLKFDTDLTPLRSRPDFQTLLAELERKFPRPEERN